MFSRTFIKDIVFKIPALKKYYIKRRTQATNDLYELGSKKLENYLEEAEKVLLSDSSVAKNVIVGLVRDGHEYEGYVKERAYYPKYERFLINNNIQYEYYDILDSNWLTNASKYDLIVWHMTSDPSTQEIATNKLYILDKVLGKKCHPSFDEIWTYEDKVNMHYLYRVHDLPEIPTFVSHSKEDALKYVNKVKYPIISKLVTGSSSFGVEKIENVREAKKIVEAAFSYKGNKTYFPYQRQKDYVLFQEFVPGAEFDLRIVVVGDKMFGYYRYPNEGDFRASGAGNYEKKEIDSKALELAYLVKEKFKCSFLATDFLYSKANQCYYIIESSIFIGIDTPSQLEIDGVAGYYQRVTENDYKFVEGKYWLQELVLKELFV